MNPKGPLEPKSKPMPSPRVSPPICSNCKNKPVAPKPATGQYFDHCSKSCATQARKHCPTQKGGQGHSTCEQCKRRPKCRKGNKVYPYCGLTCAKHAADIRQNQAKPPANPPANPLTPENVQPPPQPASAESTCKTPGCTLTVFVHPNGTLSDYCSMTHKQWGDRGCISCRAAPSNGVSVLCQPCHDNAMIMAPITVEVPENHGIYKSVKSRFKQTWKCKTTCPKVDVVYKIIVTEANHQQNRDGAEVGGNSVAMGEPRGNETQGRHGMKRKYNLGDPGNTIFCANLRGGMFETGIHASSASSKSNDYPKSLGIASGWKDLLRNKVVVENDEGSTQGDTSPTEPPPGYDSVLAEGVSGGGPNYDGPAIVHKYDAV